MVASLATVAVVGVSISTVAYTYSQKEPGIATEVAVWAGAISTTMAETVPPPPPNMIIVVVYNRVIGEGGHPVLDQNLGVEKVGCAIGLG